MPEVEMSANKMEVDSENLDVMGNMKKALKQKQTQILKSSFLEQHPSLFASLGDEEINFENSETKNISRLKRTEAEYENHHLFGIDQGSTSNFEQQYASLYYQRLLDLKPVCTKTAKEEWKEDCPEFVENLLCVRDGVRCCIVGTLFKDMKQRADTMDEFITERALLPQPIKDKYVDEEDVLIIEDESGRAQLNGNLPNDIGVTGVVIAICGKEVNQAFEVEKYCFPGLAPQIERPIPMNLNDEEDDQFVCLISGINVDPEFTECFSFQMFIDYLIGLLGDENEQQFESKIVRLIIAGDSLSERATTNAGKIVKKKQQKDGEPVKDEMVSSLKQLDHLLSQLAGGIPITVMPGKSDPANYTLPQQALHPCLFPASRAYKGNFETVTNPYSARIENIEFLGTSGQNIDDIYKYVHCKNRSEILEHTLAWRHIVPTAPDTLGCYPFTTSEPFIIQNSPHVYFAGNQPEFKQTETSNKDGSVKINCISVPKFSTTKTAVLLNLRTLKATELSFK